MRPLVDPCPACGTTACAGHSRNADPQGWLVMLRHLGGDHAACDYRGCEHLN